MNAKHFEDDFGDEPAIEERMDPYDSSEGQAFLAEFRRMYPPEPPAVYVADIPGFADWLKTWGQYMDRYFTLRAHTPERVEIVDRETDDKLSGDLIVALRSEPKAHFPLPAGLDRGQLLDFVSDAFSTMAVNNPSRRLLVRVGQTTATAWVMA